MPARRKRSGSSRASKRKKKHNKAASEVGNPPEKQVNAMESYRPTPRNQVWKIKLLGHPFNVAMNPMLPSMHPGFLPRFPTADHLAEWVFSAAKHRPVQLDLKLCERSEEVRDALLQKFSRWPETKIARAAEQFNALNQQAEQQCQEQVQLYVQELRGKLLGGMKALFWLDVLQPLKHPALLPRHEVREVLVALLEEIKTIDGLFELLIKTNERLWAVLTLPLKLEPLFQGVSTLALCGHEVSASDAMQLLIMYAEQYTVFPGRTRRILPLGLSVVASVGAFGPLDISNLSEQPEAFREKLARPLSMIIPDWVSAVGMVLEVLEKSLTNRWLSCERAPFEEELKATVQTEVQGAFARLTHALATDQLYAMRYVGGERSRTDEDLLDVTILREDNTLLVQLHRDSLLM